MTVWMSYVSQVAIECKNKGQTGTHCTTLQQTATYCNTLQHTATHCNILQHTAPHCTTLHHTATGTCVLHTHTHAYTHPHTHIHKHTHTKTHARTHTQCGVCVTVLLFWWGSSCCYFDGALPFWCVWCIFIGNCVMWSIRRGALCMLHYGTLKGSAPSEGEHEEPHQKRSTVTHTPHNVTYTVLPFWWSTSHSFQWKCNIPEIHQIERLRIPVSRGTNSNSDLGQIWICTEKFQFLDLEEFVAVAFWVETVIVCVGAPEEEHCNTQL